MITIIFISLFCPEKLFSSPRLKFMYLEIIYAAVSWLTSRDIVQLEKTGYQFSFRLVINRTEVKILRMRGICTCGITNIVRDWV